MTINEKTNTVYVANNHSDSILVIDGTAKKIVERIEIERPRELVINPDTNTLYAISGYTNWKLPDTGAKISIINLTTNQITNSIGEMEGFGDIKLNQKTKFLYATQTNSKKVWVIDTHTHTVKEKINVGGKYRSIAIDEINNIIYLAGIGPRESFALIIGKDNHTEKMASKVIFSCRDMWELYYNQTNNKLYAFVETPNWSNWDTSSIRVFDIGSKSFGKKTKLRSYRNGMGFDQSLNRFYFSDINHKKCSILNDSLQEIGSFKIEAPKRGFPFIQTDPTSRIKFAINSTLGLIYIAIPETNFLHIVKE